MSTANAQAGDNGAAKSREQIKKVPRGDKIGQHDRELLAEAVRKGRLAVTVMIATRQGSAREVESSITKAIHADEGDRRGQVQDREPEVWRARDHHRQISAVTPWCRPLR